jgi:hypothetical protein
MGLTRIAREKIEKWKHIFNQSAPPSLVVVNPMVVFSYAPALQSISSIFPDDHRDIDSERSARRVAPFSRSATAYRTVLSVPQYYLWFTNVGARVRPS